MLLVEEQRIFAREQTRAGGPADRVARRVAENGCRREQQSKPPYVEDAHGRGEQPRGDEQRVAGQKEADEESCFGEDDRRQSEVSAPGDDCADVADLME